MKKKKHSLDYSLCEPFKSFYGRDLDQILKDSKYYGEANVIDLDRENLIICNNYMQCYKLDHNGEMEEYGVSGRYDIRVNIDSLFKYEDTFIVVEKKSYSILKNYNKFYLSNIQLLRELLSIALFTSMNVKGVLHLEDGANGIFSLSFLYFDHKIYNISLNPDINSSYIKIKDEEAITLFGKILKNTRRNLENGVLIKYLDEKIVFNNYSYLKNSII